MNKQQLGFFKPYHAFEQKLHPAYMVLWLSTFMTVHRLSVSTVHYQHKHIQHIHCQTIHSTWTILHTDSTQAGTKTGSKEAAHELLVHTRLYHTAHGLPPHRLPPHRQHTGCQHTGSITQAAHSCQHTGSTKAVRHTRAAHTGCHHTDSIRVATIQAAHRLPLDTGCNSIQMLPHRQYIGHHTSSSQAPTQKSHSSVTTLTA